MGHLDITVAINLPEMAEKLCRDDTLIEVKNVAYLSNTQQLRDFARYADDQKLSKVLYVRPNTKCSQSLIDAGWNIRSLW